MTESITPLLTTTDWNEEWKALQVARNRTDEAAIWDSRAQTFPVKHGSQSGYVKRFLELAAIRPNETVLDMGCGTGALATPLAQAGHRVIACDFSRGMLSKMARDQAELGITGVEARLMSWADDWNEHGIGENCVDVALASRSIATDDLQQALLKLNAAARRRVCATLPFGPSPRIDSKLLRAAGFAERPGQDFLYAFNILAANDLRPEVSYIESVRTDTFATRDEALDTYAAIVHGAVRGTDCPGGLQEVKERLMPWLQNHLVKRGDVFTLDQDRMIVWAFIAWETQS